jgi:predicted aconitase
MQLNDEEKAMLNGDFGTAKQWAIEHQIKVGEFFDAPDMVVVSQAHMMADPESVGEAGVNFMESIANDGGKRCDPDDHRPARGRPQSLPPAWSNRRNGQ